MAPSIAISGALAVGELHDIFAYEAKSGILLWKKPESGRRGMIGKPVGFHRDGGYRTFKYRGNPYRAHVVIWAMHHGAWPKGLLDHADGNPMNNRIENLREANLSQNAQNSKMRSHNASGRKGVCMRRRSGKWIAKIQAFGKTRFLGEYETKDEAAAAYDRAAIKLHGVFAKTNAQMDAERERHRNTFTGTTSVKMFNPRHSSAIT